MHQIDTKCTKSSRYKMSRGFNSHTQKVDLKSFCWCKHTNRPTKGWDPMYSFCPPVSRGSTGASTAIIDSYPLPTVSSTNAIIGRWLAYFSVLLHTFSYNSQYLYKPQHTFVNYLLEWLIPLPWTRTPRGCNNWLYYGLPDKFFVNIHYETGTSWKSLLFGNMASKSSFA